ncbi:TPA: hypothetical protein VBX77_001775 [Yersinia enterocolitica]|nr:hypothetical protein [Yersinia enterocolitica]
MITIIDFDYTQRDQRQLEKHSYQYIYYPIAAVPVKFWAVENIELSIIAHTLIAFGRLKPFYFEDILVKMNIPKEWEEMVQYEIDHLLMKNLLKELPDKAYEAVQQEEIVSYEYKEGYMIFDEIRGEFFNYIHESDLLFQHQDLMSEHLTTNVELNRAFYEETKFDELMKTAINHYNESKKKLFKDGEYPEESDFAKEMDTSIRVEKKTFVFVKRGLMAVPLKGEVLFETDTKEQYVKIQALSPFTQQPSVQLLSLIEGQFKGKEIMDWLETVMLDDLYNFEFAKEDQEALFENIEKMLNGVQISQAAFEYLQTGEMKYIEYEKGEEAFIGERPNNLSTFNLAVEAILKVKLAQYDDIEVPKEWVSERRQGTLSKYLQAKFYAIYEYVPKAIWNNLLTIAEKMVQYRTLQSVYIYGNRDYIAALIIVDYLTNQQWMKKIAQHPESLEHAENVVSIRNKSGGHHDAELLKLSLQQYMQLFKKSRENAYKLIHFLEAN